MSLDVDSIISNAQPINLRYSWQKKIVASAMFAANSFSREQNENLGLCFAAAFDLIVAAHYYSLVGHKGWLYSPDKNKALFLYPYTNACPRSSLKDVFIYHSAHKPQSGSIGTVTSTYLGFSIEWYFLNVLKENIKVYQGSEPIDIIIKDTEQKTCFLGEIKAAPLVTFPLAVEGDIQIEEIEGRTTKIDKPREWPLSDLYHKTLSIMLFNKNFDPLLVPLGTKTDQRDQDWAAIGLLALLAQDASFFGNYYACWIDVFKRYSGTLPKRGPYWLANSCGGPVPRPSNWPRRNAGSGYETISDNKSSVGMDRTDDIKKGTYQVLKIGAETKFRDCGWNIKTGIISNLPAIRHNQEYLEPVQDILWTISEKKFVKKVGDLPHDLKIFNLFDGLISFPICHSKDEWINRVFCFSDDVREHKNGS